MPVSSQRVRLGEASKMSRNIFKIIAALAVFGWMAGGAASVEAQQGRAINASRDVGLDQKLNDHLPLDIPFRDENGKLVKIGDYFQGKPVILNLIFYRCPGICTLELDGMVKAFQKLRFEVGKEYEVVTVTINPKEGKNLAADKKEAYMGLLKRPGAEKGWHFLVGAEETLVDLPENAQRNKEILARNQENIQRLAKAVGYRYAFNLDKEEFAHPAGLTLFTPQGKISKYFFGSQFSPRDLRLALIEAADERIGTPIDQVLLRCLHFDTSTGKYSFAVVKLIQFGGALTLLTLGSFIFLMLRWERQRARLMPDGTIVADGNAHSENNPS